uniref:Uncharacterized protein n=1 Tax=Kalanchoe fedtschenkoi TaxID=63787 RepID=A0A7N0TQL9_KALFE
MKDEKRQQEKKKKKRIRNEDSVDGDRLDALPSSKKIHAAKLDDDPTSLGASFPSDHSNDSPAKAGVFDLSWMKEGAMMKTDLKFEDAFASSLDPPNFPEMLKTEDACGSQMTLDDGGRDSTCSSCKVVMRSSNHHEDHDHELECVWDSLLNQQPLSNIEFEAGRF